jgi:uncharacterized protein YcbK (DUF882 family)
MRCLALVLVLLSAPAWAAESRFYYSGDGVLRLHHAHFDEVLSVRYRDAAGAYDPQALARIEHFFRSRTDGRQGRVSLRLVELLDYFEDHYHPTQLTLVSGYRSPEFNQALRDGGRRVAQASLHTEGMAADVQPAGLNLRRLWNTLRAQQVGGVGLYQREAFLHFDTGRPRFWEAATSGVDQTPAKENAKLFARTDYDRYATLDGAVIRLHSVTALPIRIRREARLGNAVITVAPRDAAVVADGDCWLIDAPAERYELVVTTPVPPPSSRTPIRLTTCAPRIGATPAEVLTNPVSPLSAASEP